MTTKTNISDVYSEVVSDNGSTWIGEFSKKHGYKTPSLVTQLITYAQVNKLNMPVINMVQPVTSTRNSFKSGVMTRKLDSAINLSPSRLAGTPLEKAVELEVRVTATGVELVGTKFNNEESSDS